MGRRVIKRLLSPGWHFGLWCWQYKVAVVAPIVVKPSEIGLVVAADGESIPQGRILGREVSCDSFQNAETFLRRGGERGRQLAILTAGAYRIKPAFFRVLTPSSWGYVTGNLVHPLMRCALCGAAGAPPTNRSAFVEGCLSRRALANMIRARAPVRTGGSFD